MAQFLFLLFACFTVLSAVGVVVNKNAVNASICLLLCLVGVAGLFVQLDAFLLAFILLLVYAGAVVALFLFIVMLLDVQGRQSFGFTGMTTFAGLMSFALLLTGVGTIAMKGHLDAPRLNRLAAEGSHMKSYAYQLFTTYLLPVQIIGFLLLIAMLGVIVLSKKHEAQEDAP
jgi:NADH-quinone oxidoreductase subunit J